MPLDCQAREERVDLGGADFERVPLGVEKNEPPDPGDIRVLRAEAEVARAANLTNPLEQRGGEPKSYVARRPPQDEPASSFARCRVCQGTIESVCMRYTTIHRDCKGKNLSAADSSFFDTLHGPTLPLTIAISKERADPVSNWADPVSADPGQTRGRAIEDSPDRPEAVVARVEADAVADLIG